MTTEPTPAQIIEQQLDRMDREKAELKAERDKLQAFKTWVHEYLDAHGVPHHPPGTHGAEGCRIGDRMDWVFAERDRLRAMPAWPEGDTSRIATCLRFCDGYDTTTLEAWSQLDKLVQDSTESYTLATKCDRLEVEKAALLAACKSAFNSDRLIGNAAYRIVRDAIAQAEKGGS